MCMNVDKRLKELDIVPTRKMEFNEINYISQTVAKKLADNIQELSDSYNELYMRIFNCNMSYAHIDEKFGDVVYFYPNNTLYFDDSFKENKLINEYVIHECLHYLQNFKNFDGNEKKIGMCNFTEFKIWGLGLNEAIIQCIASKANGETPHRWQNNEISIYTLNNDYYPYLTSLAMELVFFTGKKWVVKEIIDGTDYFENNLYNTFEENTEKILEYFDEILNENNKTDKDTEKIIQLYLKAQKEMYETYFNKMCNRVNSLEEIRDYTEKLEEARKISASILGTSMKEYELSKYLNEIESKFNRKYMELYQKKYKKALVVSNQNKIINFLRRIASRLGFLKE